MLVNNKLDHKIENNRLVPQIDEKGHIKSSYLLINYTKNAYDIINTNENEELSQWKMENNLCKIKIYKYKFRKENDLIH